MNLNKIPRRNKDLKTYAFFANFKRIVLYLLYIAFWAVGYLVYLERPLSKPFGLWPMLIFMTAVLVSGFVIFKVNKFLFDTSIRGRIDSFKITRNYDRGMNRQGKTSLDQHTYINLYVSSGRVIKRKIKLQLFDDGYDLYYREGDSIIAFRGLNYPLCVEAEERGERICAVCGVRRYNRVQDGRLINPSDTCECCGHSFINIEDIK